MYKIGKFIFILLCVAYAFAALSQFPTLGLTLSGLLPLSIAARLFAQLPFLLVTHGKTLELILYLINTILGTAYVYLITERLSHQKKKYLAYGLSGSLLTVFSVGCVACGALLSPLMFGTIFALPLASLGFVSEIFSVLANLVLLLGVVALYRSRMS